MGQYGLKEELVFQLGPGLDATSAAINRDHYIVPTGAAAKYKVKSIDHAQSVASTSGTLKVRVITDTTAPGAAASSTCIELVGNSGNTIDTASTANTQVTATLVAGVYLYPGDRVACLSGGNQANLVGFSATVVLVPVEAGL
jgi:hypothetical protein